MNSFKEIKPQELSSNVFEMIGSDWLLISAKKEDVCNTMTASWGGLGVMWNKEVAYVVIRPQRYTKEFVDAGETFSLSVLPGTFRDTLRYFGTVSARDEDKIAKSGLHVMEDNNTPYFEEADTVLICRKLYAQAMKPEYMLNDWVDEKWYPQKDYHVLYIAAIEKVLVKE